MAEENNNTVDKENGKKPVYKRAWFWVIIVIVVLVIIACASSGSDEESKTTLTSDSSTSESEETEEETEETVTKYYVGDVYEGKDVAVKFVSSDDNFTGYHNYADIKDGYKVIKAEFEFENVGSSNFLASSYDFYCYADGYDCDDFYYVDDSSFSSDLSSGKKAKGSVYFEVPVDAESIIIEYEPDYWSSQRIEFVVK